MTSLANKLHNLELCVKSQHGQKNGYGKALREATFDHDYFMEVEVLKSIGDLHLEKGKLSKDSSEFDKAAALYAAALLRCKDPDVGETVEHRIRYMEKLSQQLLQGYSPHFPLLSPDYWGTAESNVLRVAEICDKLDRRVGKPWHSVEEIYTETLVTAIENGDMFLELELLKSLGDFYLEKGKTTSDASQFSKAVAMYNKTLATCGDPETKLTLEHRVKYAEKTKVAATQKSRRRQESLHRVHQLGSITRSTGFMQVHHLQPHVPSSRRNTTEPRIMRAADGKAEEKELKETKYTDHLKEGKSSLARADLDSAEQHFAAALKMVHARDPTAQQYQREVEPLCKLGDVYSKRGQQTGDGGDFVKAAALYIAAIARSEDQVLNGNIQVAIKEVNKAFLKCLTGNHTDCNVSQDETEKHKKQLMEMRDQIKLEMENIDQQLDPYVHDEDDPCVREIETKRAQAVRQLFEKIAQQRKEFISLLVEECIGLMGPLPCKYALIGLGSQATGLVTPYSDLEFAILVEEESEECLVYFCNLTHYLHLKVVNLGETILPSLGIKPLNDFYSKNPLDNWYYDSVTPRGFAFDGSMPKASKTPLGRQGTKNTPASKLICTPENMISIVQKDVTLYLKEGYHLASILRNPCLIAGDQDLIDMYMDITGEILQADGGKMAQQLAQETLRENSNMYKDLKSITASLIDVKKDLYRFPAVAVDCLALSSGIIPTSVWETIEEMENQQVISPNNAHHLTVLTSISAELRLRTYMANGGQKENLSALASIETEWHGKESSHTNDEVQTNTLKQIFYLPNEKQLMRYYYTAIPLKLSYFIAERSEHNLALLSFSDLYANSANIKAIMYTELCKYSQAISYYEEALKGDDVSYTVKFMLLNRLGRALSTMGDNKRAVSCIEEALSLAHGAGQSIRNPDIAISQLNLGGVHFQAGDYKKAIDYLEQALQMFLTFYGQTTANPNIALSLRIMGAAYTALGDYSEAINYSRRALQMYKSIYGESMSHPDIAYSLSNLGMAWKKLSGFENARNYLEQALQMHRSIFGHNTAHPDIATSLRNLGVVWCRLGDYRKAISYYEQALHTSKHVYGQSTAHPDIAKSFDNIGRAFVELGDHCKAINYFEQALLVYKTIYKEGKAHPDTAITLNNLGAAWNNLGNHRKAISYFEQALKIKKTIYGQSTNHPDIANSLSSLGDALGSLGDHRKAISYYEQALQIRRTIHGQTTAHSDIAASLNNLGIIWHQLGNHRKAISYLQQALQMTRSIYHREGESIAHPDIAKTLNNLGSAWYELGEYRKAISHHEQALQMYRSIYGPSTEHAVIAASLNNLGQAHTRLGDYRKAISYHEQALEMSRIMYGETIAHPDIAKTTINMGMVCSIHGDHRRAIGYYEQALQMFKSIYGQSTEHPLIATSLSNIGQTWVFLGDNKKAISYQEQALQMFRGIYGHRKPHPDIAILLNNLGNALYQLGDYGKTISYLEQALLMFRSIYGQTITHTDIATLLNNLGQAHNHFGDYKKAINYLEQALKMSRSIFGRSKAHPHIATSLNNLGLVWSNQCDNRRAIEYYEQALQMYRSIYGQSTPHPDITTILQNLGVAWYNLDNLSKALSLCQEALTMARQVFYQDKSHPLIKLIEQHMRTITAELRDNTYTGI